MSTMERIIQSYHDSWVHLDQRRTAGTQHWEPNMNLFIGGNIFYFATLAFLWWWMQDRQAKPSKPSKAKGQEAMQAWETKMADWEKLPDENKAYDPKLFMKFYNLSCVCLAGASGVLILYYKILKPGSFICNKPDINSAEGRILSLGTWVFYHQKYWEFIDTFLFMVRKSYRQVTFLHVYHHSSITFITGLSCLLDVAGDVYLPALLNSWVHVLMYGYYFCSSIGINLSFIRSSITTIQLTQFLVIAAHSIMAWFKSSDCGFADWHKLIMVLYMVSMLTLFGNFFLKQYCSGGATGAKKDKSKRS